MGGEVSCELERLSRLFDADGETICDEEYRLRRLYIEGVESRYSGGVVGSLWWPEEKLMTCRSFAICSNSRSSCACWRLNFSSSASKRLRCSRVFSNSRRFFSSYTTSQHPRLGMSLNIFLRASLAIERTA